MPQQIISLETSNEMPKVGEQITVDIFHEVQRESDESGASKLSLSLFFNDNELSLDSIDYPSSDFVNSLPIPAVSDDNNDDDIEDTNKSLAILFGSASPASPYPDEKTKVATATFTVLDDFDGSQIAVKIPTSTSVTYPPEVLIPITTNLSTEADNSAGLKVDINFLADNNGVPGEAISSGEVGVDDSFFVELKVADVRENAAGIIGLALDVEWNASVLEALNTKITDSLPLNAQGTIDNENGSIDALGAGAIPNFSQGSAIGINEPERFALVRFKGEIATDNPIPLTVTVSDPGSVAFADGMPFNGETNIKIPNIEIIDTNTSPVLVNEIEDVTTLEDSELSFIVPENTFDDTDAEDSLTYSATLKDGKPLPDWLNFNADTRKFSGTPESQDVGELKVEVTATDNSGAEISDLFTLTVQKVDDSPFVAREIKNITVDEDADNSVINLSNVFSDTDNKDTDIVKTVSVNSNETLVAASIDGNNLTLDYQNNRFGEAEITIEGESNGKKVTDTFTVKVNGVDDAPIVATEIENITVDEDAGNSVINLSNVFSDIDNNDDAIVKTISVNSNETLVAASIDGNNLTLDYQNNRSGTAEITIEGESNGKKVTDTFTVKVNGVDDAPIVATEIENITVDEDADNSAIDLKDVFSDIDNNDDAIVKTVSANSNETLVTASIDGNNLTLDYLDDRFGEAEITIEGESNGKTVTDTFKVEVNPVNDAPVVSNEIADITVLEGSELSFTVPENTFDDADVEDNLTISATLEEGRQLPDWLTFDRDTRTFSGIPESQDVDSLEVEVTATDNSGAEISDRFTLTVEDVEPDAIIAIADSSGNADDASIQFATPLSQWREGLSDSDLIRPSYPDTQQYIDITNTGEGVLNISEININADGVTAELPSGDILINPNGTQRLKLTYAPNAAEQNFSIDDGLTIVSNAVNSPEMSVSLSGKSTFDSDITYDGLVSFGDLGPLNAHWGSKSSNANFDATADINGDGVINGNDVEILNQQWNQELTFI